MGKESGILLVSGCRPHPNFPILGHWPPVTSRGGSYLCVGGALSDDVDDARVVWAAVDGVDAGEVELALGQVLGVALALRVLAVGRVMCYCDIGVT